MKVGLIGLGKMGGNMAERLRAQGHEVVGYDAFSAVTDVASLDELVAALPEPRVVWVMVPAGGPTEDTIAWLQGNLLPGDLVIDGGNSNWQDSCRRAEALKGVGIGYIDAGTSGGVWGRTEGYCLMVGGEAEHVALAQPIFDALAPVGGFVHTGPAGTGHFTKMVHNGVEYGLMQAYAEGYELLARSGLGIDAEGALSAWREGSVVRSWLLDLFVRALDQHPDFDDLAPVAQDSGEGRWTVHAAVERGVSIPVITAALYARFASQDQDGMAMRAIAALREQFGGHAVLPEVAPGEGPAPVVASGDTDAAPEQTEPRSPS
ncbi:MAG: decarboxylating 6-phosphogluconate dehydrogenase [Actinomycetota bacterium]|nr:decarboxylating 6-phosphogluconate dehydrogenase [Actinomycetota bacterium]